jgi:CheY-like chemotaxis protein
VTPTAHNAVLRLLIVDDDDAIRKLLTVIFERRGDFAVECVADGAAAVELLRRQHFDIILLDLMLPLKNGFEVIREMKSFSPPILLRTIVVTAASQATLRDFEDAKLLRGLVRKPFDLPDLISEVLACGRQAEMGQE